MAKFIGGTMKYWDVRVSLKDGNWCDYNWAWYMTDQDWVYIYRRSGRVITFNKDIVRCVEHLKESEEEDNG